MLYCRNCRIARENPRQSRPFRRRIGRLDDFALRSPYGALLRLAALRNLEEAMKLEGGCYCGEVRYVAEGDPMMKAQCHCRECQYITGGGPNMFIAMPVAGFSYTKGQPKQFKRSDLERPVTREFCPECGTHVTTRPQGFPAVIVKVGTLDDPKLFGMPQMAIYTCDKQPFHEIPQGLKTFERLPQR
jgi:hypothetical protein